MLLKEDQDCQSLIGFVYISRELLSRMKFTVL